MKSPVLTRRFWVSTGAVAAVTLLTQAALPQHAAATGDHHSGPATLPSSPFVTGPPEPGDKGPDDITRLAVDDFDHGRSVVWTAFQNGVPTDGAGGGHSTVAGYDRKTGALIEAIHVTGKVDGLTADPMLHRLIATVNEDNNSALNVIDVVTETVTRYTYSPSPAVSMAGGTDSIAIWNGHIVVAHSNPFDATQATDFEVTLDKATHTAKLKPLFFDDSTAIDAVTHKATTLALTDPDTNSVIPDEAPSFANQLATIGQADGQIVFARHRDDDAGSHFALTVLNLTDNKPGNTPPTDGLAVATADSGTLYVVDATAGTISKLDTTGWPAGTVFIGEPSDNGNPIVGTLNLKTGVITPLGNTFASPKGLLFVPHDEEGDD